MKLPDAIKTWNRINPIQQQQINFKTRLRTTHQELTETGEITIEDAGYHQANLVNYIVAHMSGIPFTYSPQDPDYTLTPNTSPTIVPTVQPIPVANVATYVSNIISQILTSMQKMHQLLIQMRAYQTGGGGKTSNCNNHTRQAATEPRQGQPHNPLPDFANKYCWTHGKYAYEGEACTNKAPKHQYTETFSSKRGGSTYGCSCQEGLTSLMMLIIDNKINFLQQTNKTFLDPTPQIVARQQTPEQQRTTSPKLMPMH